ncbi:hypothetical protein FRB99_001679, partial [Tulasnella sp. 403]
MSEYGGSHSRLSQGPSVLRKGARALPTYRNDANFGRATGKIMNIGDLERDQDGFEDFNEYLQDDIFLSPPPAIPTRPKPKPKPQPKYKPSVLSDEDRDERTGRDESPDDLVQLTETVRITSKKTATVVPGSASKQIGSQSRPAPSNVPVVDYDSIPEPQPRRKVAPHRPNQPSKAVTQSTTTRPARPPITETRRALPVIDEDDDASDQGNEDSNMSMASVVERNQSPDAGPINADDDDSGPEGFGGDADDYGDNDGMDVDPQPELEDEDEPVMPRAQQKSTTKSRFEPPPDDDDEMMESADDVGQDVSIANEPQQYEEQEESEEEETPQARKARLAQEREQRRREEQEKKKASRPPLKARDPNASPKKKTKAKRTWVPEDEEIDGVRKSKRHRYRPLEFWRGEHAVIRRPRRNDPPVPIITEIIRVPEEHVEPLGKKHKRRGATKPPSSRGPGRPPKEVYMDDPEEGWDEGTASDAMVMDYDTKEVIKQVVAKTRAMLDPKTPPGQEYSFEKVFTDAEFIAGGVLNLPKGARKPPKPSKDNTYIFYCIEGAVRVMIHKSSFIITTNGMFMIPRGNQYALENVCDREVKL